MGKTNWKPKKIKRMRRKNPYRVRNCSSCGGMPGSAKRILEPSSGGIGKRLNIPSNRLRNTIIPNIIATGNRGSFTAAKEDSGMNRKAIPNTRASVKFDAGPANPIRAEPNFGLERLYGWYGTGFAQPKAKPKNSMEKIGKIMVPSGSM